jgi:hypothetical protein
VNRKFVDDKLGNLFGDWFDFLFQLGENSATAKYENLKYVLLVPTASFTPHIIATGAISGFLQSSLTTGFIPATEAKEKLLSSEKGVEVSVVDKELDTLKPVVGALDTIDIERSVFWLKISSNDIKYANPAFPLDNDRYLVSITNKPFVIPDKPTEQVSNVDMSNFPSYYKNVDVLGLFGLPKNMIQIAGNKKELVGQSNTQFQINKEIKYSFADLLLLNRSKKEMFLTNILSSNEDKLIDESELSIFVQNPNTNLESIFEWENGKTQIILIPKTSRNAPTLVDLYNKEYLFRENEEELELYPDYIPKGCEIMAYQV